MLLTFIYTIILNNLSSTMFTYTWFHAINWQMKNPNKFTCINKEIYNKVASTYKWEQWFLLMPWFWKKCLLMIPISWITEKNHFILKLAISGRKYVQMQVNVNWLLGKSLSRLSNKVIFKLLITTMSC